ncbi:MAG TPA: hypothetical protein VEB86_04105, partial [Chryseosolibacter sp.]|nr:hypothetical protein [Chryseosolibacter sp.]
MTQSLQTVASTLPLNALQLHAPGTLDELFRRVTADDYHAFEKIFNGHYKSLCNYACRFVKSHELSEEIVD